MSVSPFTIVLPKKVGDPVETPGVDWNSRVRLVHRRGAYAVLRFSSGSHWSGLGSRSQHPSNWMLIRVEHVEISASRSLTGRAFTKDEATVLDECEPGTRWRETKIAMIAKCDALAEGGRTNVANQVDRKTMVRWLLQNGFSELPGKATGHRFFAKDGVKITISSHGPSDLTKKNVAFILRSLARIGFDPADVRRQLGEA